MSSEKQIEMSGQKENVYSLASTHLAEYLEREGIAGQESNLEDLKGMIEEGEKWFSSRKGRLAGLLKTDKWKYKKNMDSYQKKLAEVYSKDLAVSKEILQFLQATKDPDLHEVERAFFNRIRLDKNAFPDHIGGPAAYFEKCGIFFPDHIRQIVSDGLSIPSTENISFGGVLRSVVDDLCEHPDMYSDLMEGLFDKALEVYTIEKNRIKSGHEERIYYLSFNGATSLLSHCEDTIWKLGKSLGYEGKDIFEMSSAREAVAIHGKEKSSANWYRNETSGKYL